MSHYNTISYKLKEKKYLPNKTRGTFVPISWCSMNVIYCRHQYWSSLLNLVPKATPSKWRVRNIGLAYIATSFTNLLGDVKCKCDYILNINFIKVFLCFISHNSKTAKKQFLMHEWSSHLLGTAQPSSAY